MLQVTMSMYQGHSDYFVPQLLLTLYTDGETAAQPLASLRSHRLSELYKYASSTVARSLSYIGSVVNGVETIRED